MRIACWIPKATNTFSRYEILNAFPLQKFLHECFSILLYTYSASLFLFPLCCKFLCSNKCLASDMTDKAAHACMANCKVALLMLGLNKVAIY